MAEILGKGKTFFEKLQERQESVGSEKWAPFEDQEEWELAQWLLRSVGQKKIDEYLKLPIVSYLIIRDRLSLINKWLKTVKRTKPSFNNTYSFLKKIDQLPTGSDWVCDIVDVTGNRVGPNGEKLTEELELWRRDPVECIKELLGNPAFRETISYVPERVYSDHEGKDRIYDEMWTAEYCTGKTTCWCSCCTCYSCIRQDKLLATYLRRLQS